MVSLSSSASYAAPCSLERRIAGSPTTYIRWVKKGFIKEDQLHISRAKMCDYLPTEEMEDGRYMAQGWKKERRLHNKRPKVNKAYSDCENKQG